MHKDYQHDSKKDRREQGVSVGLALIVSFGIFVKLPVSLERVTVPPPHKSFHRVLWPELGLYGPIRSAQSPVPVLYQAEPPGAQTRDSHSSLKAS